MPGRKAKTNPAASTRTALEEFLESRGIDSLDEIDSEREAIPSNIVELTPEERRLLKDPDWIDQEDADTILGERDKEKGQPFEEYLRERGIKL